MGVRSRKTSVRLRWAVAVLSGIVAAVPVSAVFGVATGLVAGWGVLSLAGVIWPLLQLWGMDAEATRDHATSEDPGRRVARIIAIAGSLVSLAAVAVVIVQARRAPDAEAFVLAGIAVLSVASSWALIQTDYMLHYARVYYEDDGEGIRRGIDFNQREDPCYTDFAYFSVGLGMTYQVSDTDVTSNAIRRIVIAQTMLAYLFGAGILAAVINLIAGLG